MNIFKSIWNSKAFNTAADINYEVLKAAGKVIKATAEVTCDVLTGIANNAVETNENQMSVEQETYEYWKGLSCVEQQDYFALNYKLQEYGENYRYDNAEQMAKSIAEIARRENRAFTNKYDRY